MSLAILLALKKRRTIPSSLILISYTVMNERGRDREGGREGGRERERERERTRHSNRIRRQ